MRRTTKSEEDNKVEPVPKEKTLDQMWLGREDKGEKETFIFIWKKMEKNNSVSINIGNVAMVVLNL